MLNLFTTNSPNPDKSNLEKKTRKKKNIISGRFI